MEVIGEKSGIKHCPDCGDEHAFVPETLEFCRRCKKDYYGQDPDPEEKMSF